MGVSIRCEPFIIRTKPERKIHHEDQRSALNFNLVHTPIIIVLFFCRLYGNYENLSSGSTTRSLQDLTGGIVQSFGLSHQDRYLTFQVLNSAVPRSSLLIATITPVSIRNIVNNCRFSGDRFRKSIAFLPLLF